MIDDFVPRRASGRGKIRLRPADNPERPRTTRPIQQSPAADDIETVNLDTAGSGTASEESQQLQEPSQTDADGSVGKRKRRPIKWLKRKWRGLSKKKKVLAIAMAIIILIAIVIAALTLLQSPAGVAVKKPTPHKVTNAKPIVLTSKLTGLPISSASINDRPVTGVMIENSDGARPQSGLDQAGVVFEAVAEAGITRFLALYQDTQPSYLGPVRSARPYFVQWCMGFDCALAHVGGSPEALSDIQSWGVPNLDQFYNPGAYERVSNRAAPHNVYTSAAQLNSLEASKDITTSTFTGWPRKKDSPSKSPAAASIDIDPSSADFESNYDYDPGSDSYKRSESGAPHTELDSSGHQTQIAPKVVIAMVVPQSRGALDASGAYYTTYQTIGSGQAYVFQDGNVTIGTWQKTSNSSQIKFTNTAGQPIKLNAGQTWVAAVGTASDVSYKP